MRPSKAAMQTDQNYTQALFLEVLPKIITWMSFAVRCNLFCEIALGFGHAFTSIVACLHPTIRIAAFESAIVLLYGLQLG